MAGNRAVRLGGLRRHRELTKVTAHICYAVPGGDTAVAWQEDMALLAHIPSKSRICLRLEVCHPYSAVGPARARAARARARTNLETTVVCATAIPSAAGAFLWCVWIAVRSTIPRRAAWLVRAGLRPVWPRVVRKYANSKSTAKSIGLCGTRMASRVGLANGAGSKGQLAGGDVPYL